MHLLKDTSFEEAKSIFRKFLYEQKLSQEILWVFKEDTLVSNEFVFIRFNISSRNEDFAERLYEKGLSKNLGICFHAFAFTESMLFCYIEVPDNQDESERHLFNNLHLKCSIRSSVLKSKIETNSIKWNVFRLFYRSLNELPSKSSVS